MINNIVQSVLRKRSEIVFSRIWPYIQSSQSIVDIGSGTGDVASLIQHKGKKIVAVDVDDFHGPRLIKTTIYDGKTLPFLSKQFDMALLLMVMHHTQDPSVVFKEASRVAKELVVIETSYSNGVDRFFTIIADIIGNLRLDAQWQSYKSDHEWKQFFRNHGLTVVKTQKYPDRVFRFVPFLHILYYLKKV